MKPFRIESLKGQGRRRMSDWPATARGGTAEPAHPDDVAQARIRAELAAIGAETCTAALRILTATEKLADLLREHGIDRAADPLMAALFEACSFQDLTGQRLGKIQALLDGGVPVGIKLDPPCPPTTQAPALPAGLQPCQSDVAQMAPDEIGRRLVNGPRVAQAEGHMDQSSIDALFD